MNFSFLPIVFVFILAIVLFFRVIAGGRREEDIKKARFKAVFNVTPKSRKANLAVSHKISELRTLASVGDEDDIRLLQIALKSAKQCGFV